MACTHCFLPRVGLAQACPNYCWGDKIKPILYEQQLQDIHILVNLGTQKYCFKVTLNVSSYTRAFRSIFNKDHTKFSKIYFYLIYY